MTIIDDATSHHQILTLKTLWPYLNADGVYIIENCHTSMFDFMLSEYFNNLKVASFAFYQNDKNLSDDSLTLTITKAPNRINETRWNKKQ